MGLWDVFKAKNSNSYCSSEGRSRSNPKKYSDSTKKVRLGFRAFRTCFWEVDHPLWDVFKAENSNSYCSSEGRSRSNPKKYSYSTKKVRLGFRAFRTYFWEVDHPLWDVFKAKNSNSYCSSEGRYRSNPKKFPSRQKKYSYGLERFAPIFGKLTTPSVMFLKQKTQILIAHQKEDIDRTQKSSLVGKKSTAMV